MKLDINLLPKKLNDVNYFKKVEGGCEIYSYNSKFQLRNEVVVVSLPGCEIENDFCIDNKAIEMLKLLKPEEINITDKSFIIKSSKGKYTGKLINENLFQLSKENLDSYTNVNLDNLNKACNFTAKTDKKPQLAGVRVDNNGNIIATDSFTLYTYNNNHNEYTVDGFTLPVSFIQIVKSLTNETELNVYNNQNIAMVKIDNVKIYTNLISGAYPDVRKLLDTNQIEKIENTDNQEIIEKVDIASKLTSNVDDNRTIYIEFSFNKLAAYGDDTFETDINFDCGIENHIRVSNILLMQALKSINGDYDFKIRYDANRKGTMLYLTNENELCLVLGIRSN